MHGIFIWLQNYRLITISCLYICTKKQQIVLWKSALEANSPICSYSYEYDALNRLKKADYRASTNGTIWNQEVGYFNEEITGYDANGNILGINRRGLQKINPATATTPAVANFGLIDDLTYSYNGNQLVAVSDAANPSQVSGIAGDFQDRRSYTYQTSHAPSSHEYRYDANGNANSDDNKEIQTIQYNHLTKATYILYQNGNSIKYVYDAAGIKLYKITNEDPTGANITVQTDYVGGFVYQENELQFIATPKGKALAPHQLGNESSGFVYEYRYTDHLGNLRMTFREATQVNPFVATMETTEPEKTNEEREFANISLTRVGNKGKASSSSAKLNAAENKTLGPWKSLPVRQGDQIDVKVFANYLNPDNQSFNIPATFLTFLSGLPGYGSQTINGETTQPNFPISNITVGLTAGLIPNNANTSSTLPSAYLYLIFYPENGGNPTPYYKRISTLAKGNEVWEELTLPHFTAPAKGRVEIFVVNESSLDVWFDDLTIAFEGALIAQENHYDPWGLELAGIGKQGLDRFTFNAQSEKQKDLNGGKGYFYETDFRGYDPQLGRFHGYDALASAFSGITPYQFGFNNPMRFNDPTGLSANDFFKGSNGSVVWREGSESFSIDGEEFTSIGDTYTQETDGGTVIHTENADGKGYNTTVAESEVGGSTSSGGQNNFVSTASIVPFENLNFGFNPQSVAPFSAYNGYQRYKYYKDALALKSLYNPNPEEISNREGIRQRTDLKIAARKNSIGGFGRVLDIVEGPPDKKATILNNKGEVRRFYSTNRLFNSMSMGGGILSLFSLGYTTNRILQSENMIEETLVVGTGYVGAFLGMTFSAPIATFAGTASAPIITPAGGAFVAGSIIYTGGSVGGYYGEELMKWLLSKENK